MFHKVETALSLILLTYWIIRPVNGENTKVTINFAVIWGLYIKQQNEKLSNGIKQNLWMLQIKADIQIMGPSRDPPKCETINECTE